MGALVGSIFAVAEANYVAAIHHTASIKFPSHDTSMKVEPAIEESHNL